MWTPDQIASATGDPVDAIAHIWPQVVSALDQEGINSHPTRIAAAATAAVEMDFEYLTELASGADYEGRADLGNAQPGDGERYKGRGVVQITGRANYATYGQRLGLDLLNHPELACDPHVAGLILALYFTDHGIPAMAANQDWEGVRRAVNGGLTGWDRFITCVTNLAALPDTDTSASPVKHWQVTTAGTLKTDANHTCPAAIDEHHRPVVLQLGAIVVPTGRTQAGWTEITLPPPSQVHGWFPSTDIGPE